METADMVKVAVSAAPYSIDKPYSYLVPDALAAAAVPGVRVMVPFGRGNKESEGLILARVQEPKLPGSKAIRQILDPEPVLDKAGIDLALWMRGRYFCTVFEAVKTILPAGLWYGLREIWSLAMAPEAARSAAVGIPGAWQVLDLLEKQGGKADIRVLRDALGDGAEKPLKAMKKAEILTCETDAKRKIADKSHRMVELAVNTEDAYALTEPKRRSAPARYEVVNFLATAGRTPAAEVSYYTGASARTLKTMEKAGLIAFSEEEELRVPSLDDVEPGPEIVLNEEQQRAFEEILGRVQAAKPSVTLLHGVTGSGKTQVYLRLVQETLALGKTAMVLVPEIVLTPQMMRKFSSYFGSRVAMLHSSLKMTERYDQWKRIRRGEVDVVLGTRSALFAPLKNLGLIIMDEEQEGSYQSENVPRYDAREVAKYLCVREKAALVFGSATPTVETAWAVEQGSYQKALLQFCAGTGDKDMALERVEAFYHDTQPVNGLRMNGAFTMFQNGAQTQLLRTPDVAWVYQVTTQHRVNFIPAGKSFAMRLWALDGRSWNLPMKKQEAVQNTMRMIFERFPHVLVGYSAPLVALAKKDNAAFRAQVAQGAQAQHAPQPEAGVQQPVAPVQE